VPWILDGKKVYELDDVHLLRLRNHSGKDARETPTTSLGWKVVVKREQRFFGIRWHNAMMEILIGIVFVAVCAGITWA
jgi:hypothetical protein